MTDPVAEAAAQIAAQQAEPSLLDKAMDTIHDLEAKVEHLIHPDAVQSTVSAPVAAAVLSTLDTLQAAESVPNVTPGSPAIAASATLSDAPGQSIESASSAKPSESLPTEAPAPATPSASSEPSTTIPTSSAGSESPNAVGSASTTEVMTEPSAVSGAASPESSSSNGVLNESMPNADSGLVVEAGNVAGAAVDGAPEAGVVAVGGGEGGANLPVGESIAPGVDVSAPGPTQEDIGFVNPVGTKDSVEVPNAATGAVALPAIVASALGASIPAGIQGIVANSTAEPVKLASAATNAIKVGIANIKHHLSIRGFEQSAVADIHAELEAIEKWL